MGQRRAGRELALQALYAVDLNPREAQRGVLRIFWENAKAAAGVISFARDLVDGVVSHREEIDGRIQERSKNWTIGRMAKVDLNILRMAVYEFLYRNDIPRVVTINEAIELAKTFGNEDSPAFVNGILDDISGQLPPDKSEVA